jgi:hypothetical protein
MAPRRWVENHLAYTLLHYYMVSNHRHSAEIIVFNKRSEQSEHSEVKGVKKAQNIWIWMGGQASKKLRVFKNFGFQIFGIKYSLPKIKF